MKTHTQRMEQISSSPILKAVFESSPGITRLALGKGYRGFIVKSVCAAALLVLAAANNGHAADLSLKRQNVTTNDLRKELSGFQLDTKLAVAVHTNRDRAKQYPKLVQHLESLLIDAKELAATKGVEQSVKALTTSGQRMQGENVIVIVECAQATDPKEVAKLVTAKGGTVIRTGESHVKATVPITALEDIACNIPGVSFVRTPIEKSPMNTVTTEGRSATLTSPWHAAGILGQGVKIAVLDSEFLGLATRKAQDEIPASAVELDFSGTGMESGTGGHGCACAEIINDFAPGCQLYLLKSLDNSDDEAAKNYCKAQGIQIISVSETYRNVNFYDGTAPSSITPHPVTIVNDANANGILWVNAAGNYQEKHALIAWQDANADGYLDWGPSPNYMPVNELWNNDNPIPVGAVIDVSLTWNKWPVTDQDFGLDLYRWNGSTWTFVTTADNVQNGTQLPREHLVYNVPTAAFYAVGIYRTSATTAPEFVLRSATYIPWFYSYNNTSIPVPGSLGCPADAASCFTVGAIDFANYPSGPIESYSSLGPNNGAYTGNPTVVKPDICAPTWVSTATFGATGFGGTSASAPHIAGLAALVKCAFPSYTPAQIKSYIEANGFDLGIAGKDNTYGSGAARLPSPPVSSYTVTFDAQGGTTPNPTSKIVTYASTYGTLATTARTGYSFGGWWTGINGAGTQVTSATTVNITAAQTLYALWPHTTAGTPHLWLDQYGLVSGTNYEAADVCDTDGDGYTAWQEYVAGTVPTNRASAFKCLVSMSNGLPRVAWTPNLGIGRVYTVEGRPKLTVGVWGITNASSRFFRVKVGLP